MVVGALDLEDAFRIFPDDGGGDRERVQIFLVPAILFFGCDGYDCTLRDPHRGSGRIQRFSAPGRGCSLHGKQV
jgi:hypothetical protein